MTTARCRYCDKEFKKGYDKRRAYRFCSWECYLKYKREFPRKTDNCICRVCGKKFHTRPSAIAHGEGIYCSKECKYEYQRMGIKMGKESYNERHLLRQSSQYKIWRRAAKKLHGNICDKCGIKDRSICKCCGNVIYLHVHHIKPFSPFPELRFDPSNSSVLCPKCHKD
jgi:hypothetical protein